MELVIGSAEPTGPPAFLIGERRRQSSRPSRRAGTSNASEKPDGRSDSHCIELVLYISSTSPHSTVALRNLRHALANFAGRRITLTVHDLSKDPQRAERDGVHFTPSLVTTGRGPKTWIVGHLGNPQVLQTLLESALESAE